MAAKVQRRTCRSDVLTTRSFLPRSPRELPTKTEGESHELNLRLWGRRLTSIYTPIDATSRQRET